MDRISAGFSGPIASAVAAEVNRLSQHPELGRSEGSAYKAAWERQVAPRQKWGAGSPAFGLIHAFERDSLRCVVLARWTHHGCRPAEWALA